MGRFDKAGSARQRCTPLRGVDVDVGVIDVVVKSVYVGT